MSWILKRILDFMILYDWQFYGFLLQRSNNLLFPSFSFNWLTYKWYLHKEKILKYALNIVEYQEMVEKILKNFQS